MKLWNVYRGWHENMCWFQSMGKSNIRKGLSNKFCLHHCGCFQFFTTSVASVKQYVVLKINSSRNISKLQETQNVQHCLLLQVHFEPFLLWTYIHGKRKKSITKEPLLGILPMGFMVDIQNVLHTCCQMARLWCAQLYQHHSTLIQTK